MHKLLQGIQKHLIVAIPVMMFAGFAVGAVWDAAPLKGLIVPMTFLMVYPMMVNLQLASIVKGGDGKVQLTAQLLNFAVIPLLAFAIGKAVFPESPYFALGLLLAALLPTSGMTISWTGMAQGNMGAAVKMTVVGLLLGSALTPLYIQGLMGAAVEVPMSRIFQQILVVVVLPLVLGNLTRRLLVARYGMARYQKDLKGLFPPLSTLGVLGIVFVALALKADSILANPAQLLKIALPLILLYAVNFALSAVVGRLFFRRGDAIALVYGTVMRNLSIALAIAMTAFGEEGSEIALIIAMAYIIQVQSAAWFVRWTDRIFGPAPEATVGDVMEEGVFALHAGDTLQQAIQLLAEEHIHSVAVLDAGEKPVGMVTARIVIDALADETPVKTPLRDLALEPVLIATASTPLKAAVAAMKRSHEYKALVLDDRQAVTHVLTQEDVLAHYAGKRQTGVSSVAR